MAQSTTPHEQPEWLPAFLDRARERKIASGTRIIEGGEQSSSIFYLRRGSVSVVIEDEEGHELILAYLNRGEFFGEMGMFDEQTRRSARVVARGECLVAEADYTDFADIPEQAPRILFEIARQLASRLRRTSAKVRDLAFLDVTGRVARCLLDLTQQPDAMTHPDGMQVHITRQEIARNVGCSREMVGRVVRELEDDGLIRAHGKTIVVLGCR